MAERRMFAKSIVLSDAFLDMPLSARCLYFTLGMLADDDGFVGNPKSIMRQCGASQDDMNVLIGKRYVLGFESGVIVIKHWRMNNYLRNDRYHTTTYLEEKETLLIDERGAYTEKCKNTGLLEVGIPSGNQVVDERYTEVSIGKYRVGKDSIDKKEKINKKEKSFQKPSVEEIEAYCIERGNNIRAEQFFDYYESKGWMIGKNKMKDWKAAVRTWENNDNNRKGATNGNAERRTSGNVESDEDLQRRFEQVQRQLAEDDGIDEWA